MTDPEIAVHDHLRPVDADVPPGVYRVVGVDGTGVRLLRVADDDGSRVTTGHVVSVDRGALEGFGPAENPDAGLSPLSTLRDGLEGIGILLRELVR